MSKKTRRISLAVIIFVLLSLLSTYFIGDYFVNYALVPNQGAETREINEDATITLEDEAQQRIDSNREEAEDFRDRWLEEVKDQTEDVAIKTHDGHELKGHLYKQETQSHKWILLVHGYQSSEASVQIAAPMYYKEGYNVLTFSMRAHEPSEGSYITMGYYEALDVIAWAQYIVDRDPKSEIALHGTSMGGAAVMKASDQETLPANVKAIIEDCGYSTTWDIFAHELDARFNLPAFPVLHMAEVMGAYRADFWLGKNRPIDAVQATDRPMLFIHGDADDFVPVEMSRELYAAYPGDTKDLLIVEGAGHNESKYLDPDIYYQTVFTFLEQYMQ